MRYESGTGPNLGIRQGVCQQLQCRQCNAKGENRLPSPSLRVVLCAKSLHSARQGAVSWRRLWVTMQRAGMREEEAASEDVGSADSPDMVKWKEVGRYTASG